MTIMSLLWDVVCFALHVTELRLGAYLPSVTHSCLMYLLSTVVASLHIML